MTKGEKRLKDSLQERGCKVLNKGWPDFLVVDPSGSVFCIEEKSEPIGGIRKHQKEVHAILQSINVPVFISRKGQLNNDILEIIERSGVRNFYEKIDEIKRLYSKIRKLRIKNSALRQQVTNLKKARKEYRAT